MLCLPTITDPKYHTQHHHNDNEQGSEDGEEGHTLRQGIQTISLRCFVVVVVSVSVTAESKQVPHENLLIAGTDMPSCRRCHTPSSSVYHHVACLVHINLVNTGTNAIGYLGRSAVDIHKMRGSTYRTKCLLAKTFANGFYFVL